MLRTICFKSMSNPFKIMLYISLNFFFSFSFRLAPPKEKTKFAMFKLLPEIFANLCAWKETASKNVDSCSHRRRYFISIFSSFIYPHIYIVYCYCYDFMWIATRLLLFLFTEYTFVIPPYFFFFFVAAAAAHATAALLCSALRLCSRSCAVVAFFGG